MIFVSLGILVIEPSNCPGGSSYRSSIYWFLLAVAIQFTREMTNLFWKSKDDLRDKFNKFTTLALIGLFGYLLCYFVIYEGCEELIEFWVLGNLWIMIVFVGAKMAFILW